MTGRLISTMIVQNICRCLGKEVAVEIFIHVGVATF